VLQKKTFWLQDVGASWWRWWGWFSVDAVLLMRCVSVFVAVVLDRKNDKLCDTGLFELIYRQPPITDPPQLDSNLCVEGRKVKCSSDVLPWCHPYACLLPWQHVSLSTSQNIVVCVGNFQIRYENLVSFHCIALCHLLLNVLFAQLLIYLLFTLPQFYHHTAGCVIRHFVN